MHYEKNETEDIEEVLTDMQGNAEQKKAKRIVIVLMTIAIMLLAVIIGVNIYNAPARHLAEQLNLGNRYLDEMDYEQAVVAFTKAIEIDSTSADAYLGAADAYIGLGDFESAKSVLEQGMENITDVSLREKVKDKQAEIDRIEKEIEEQKRAEEKAKQEAEERKKIEAALEPLYEKMEAGEEDEVIIDYVWQERLIEIEGSYSPTGDVKNGIVLDMRNDYFFFGEKTDNSYETTGNWYIIYGNDNEAGIVEFAKYEGEWKNGMPNGQGTLMIIAEGSCTNHGINGGIENTGNCIDRYIIVSNFKDGYADGNIRRTCYMDIYDWLKWWDFLKREEKYTAKTERLLEVAKVTGFMMMEVNQDGKPVKWMDMMLNMSLVRG